MTLPRTSVLVVCTGNVCRSPVAERILEGLGLPGVHAASAGTEAAVGSPIDAPLRQLLEEDGISAAGFHARQLTTAMIRDSDLILAATQDHRDAVLREAPGALRRTFTLLEIADLIELAERDGPLGPMDRMSRLSTLASLRGARHAEAHDDIPDPHLRSRAHHLQAYRTIARAARGPIRRLLASFAEPCPTAARPLP